MLSDSAIDLLMNGYKYAVADNLKQKANLDSVMEARLNLWWKEESAEYKFDETDMYLAYARNIILNWAYRILFAHLIKQRQNGALFVDKIDFHTTPIEADEIFKKLRQDVISIMSLWVCGITLSYLPTLGLLWWSFRCSFVSTERYPSIKPCFNISWNVL